MKSRGDAIEMIAPDHNLPDCDRDFWIAIRLAGVTSASRWLDLQERFGSGEAAWNATEPQLRAVFGNREKMLSGFLAARARLNPTEASSRLASSGVAAVTMFDSSYPPALAQIAAPPPVLFQRGQIIETDELAVAVVGTRAPTSYGKDIARSISADLARAGITIVSGLAKGIDGVAHQAALDAGGRTIAVLGSGIHDIYPRDHRLLASRIAEQGCVISDYLPDAKPDRWNFPARNRIISGLSRGVLVVEAPERSGALITVDFAADQGRDVFAVPGPLTSSASAGTNRLLRDGARLVRNAGDILEDLLLFGSPTVATEVHQPSLILDEDERRVYGFLTATPLHIDDIVEASGLPLPRISAILLALELQQQAQNVGAQHYIRC